MYKGKKFSNVDEYQKAMRQMETSLGESYKYRECAYKRKDPRFSGVNYRYYCARSHGYYCGDGNIHRPNRTSLKCNCGWYVNATNPMLPDNSGRDMSCVVVSGARLEHTNGCTGNDPDLNSAIQKRSGRKYSDAVLAHLSSEVKSGRYSTRDVHDWLENNGHRSASRLEAKNLRARLLKNQPIRGWDVSDPVSVGEIDDYLYNVDLARELEAGGQESIDNLQLVLTGLQAQEHGFDYRLTSDSESRFSGVAWQTGRMRARGRVHAHVIFIDDSKSGISTTRMCFWNIVIVDHNGKTQTIMGCMTMDPSNAAVYWVLSSLVSMCPELKEMVETTMSDLAVSPADVKRALTPKYCATCTWHLMIIDFPANLKHIVGYNECKNFVYANLVRNTVSKIEWEYHLSHACRTWPAAANYLQTLSVTKERWGAPWRLSNFTLGMEASSVVEGSFSAFQRALGHEPRSFVGVIQQHVKKDKEKHAEEKALFLRDQVRQHDVSLAATRSDPVNACAKIFSEKTTKKFEEINVESQNYEKKSFLSIQELTHPPAEDGPMSDVQGVEGLFEVTRRTSPSNRANPPRPRVVWLSNGIWRCTCLNDINTGLPCRHIQCVLSGAFKGKQFHKHFRRGIKPEVHDRVQHIEPIIDSSPFNPDSDQNAPIDDDIYVGSADNDVVEQAKASTDVRDPQSAKFVARSKKLSSTAKFNNLLAEGTHLARVASSDKDDQYQKLLAVLRHLRANYQNKTCDELKEASVNYLELGPSAETRVLLPSVLKRTAGRASIKRKKSAVENAVTGTKRGKTCDFCGGSGHNKATCEVVRPLGKRLTKVTWGLLSNSPCLDEALVDNRIDTIVPKDAMALQVLGCVAAHEAVVYKAVVVLKSLQIKEGVTYWLKREVIDEWAKEGKSGVHFVFLKDV